MNKKKKMSEIKQPEDLTFELDGRGGSGKITFIAFGYPYDKGADGRFKIETKREMYEGGSREEADLKVNIDLNTCFYGLTYDNLIKLSIWAKNAAEFVKDTRIHNGYSVNPD